MLKTTYTISPLGLSDVELEDCGCFTRSSILCGPPGGISNELVADSCSSVKQHVQPSNNNYSFVLKIHEIAHISIPK